MCTCSHVLIFIFGFDFYFVVEWLKGKWSSLKKDKQNAVTYFQKVSNTLLLLLLLLFIHVIIQCSDLLDSLKDDSTDMETHDMNDSNVFLTYINLPNCNNDSIITEGIINTSQYILIIIILL